MALAAGAQMYWPVLAGATGFLYGNYPIWPFWNAGDPAWGFGDGSFTGDWVAALDNPGAHAATIAADFFTAIDWASLIPDVRHDVVTGGFGSYGSSSYALTATNTTHTLAVVYLSDDALSLTVALDTFAADTVTVRWFDPSVGAFSNAPGSPFAATGTTSISPSGFNTEGYRDWVLVLESP